MLLQVAMSAYKLRRLKQEAGDLCGTVVHEDQNAFFSLFGSLGIVKPFGTGSVDHSVGFTLVVPHWDRASQTILKQSARCGPIDFAYNHASVVTDRVLWTGLTYAVRPWRFLQVGVTLGFGARAYTFEQLTVTVIGLGCRRSSLYLSIGGAFRF